MMPNKITLFFVLLLSASLAACKKDQGIELVVLTNTFDFEVKAGLNTSVTHFFLSDPINNTLAAQLDAIGRSIDDVGPIYAKYAEMSSVFNDVDLDFISAVEIRIFDPFVQESAREIFYLVPVPANTNTIIRPFPGLQDVYDIATGNTYGIEVRLIFRRVPTTTFEMRLDMQLSAKQK